MTPEFPLSRRQGPLSPLPQTLLDDRPNSRDIWGFRNLENLRLSGLGFDLGSGHIRTVRSLISVEPEHQQGHLLFLHTFREEQASPFFKGIVNHSLPASCSFLAPRTGRPPRLWYRRRGAFYPPLRDQRRRCSRVSVEGQLPFCQHGAGDLHGFWTLVPGSAPSVPLSHLNICRHLPATYPV
jgi:hypothetical protein